MNYRQFTKRYIRPNWQWYLSGALFLAATTYITVKVPELAGRITDTLDQHHRSDLADLALSIILLSFAQVMCRALSRLLIFWPGRKIEASAKVDLFRHATTLPMSFYDRFGVGDLVSRFSNDMGQIRVVFAFGILMLINLVFMASMILTQMISKNLTLTLFCLSPLILMVVITRIAMPTLHKYNKLNQETLGDLTGQVTGAFVNIQQIKTAGREETFSKKIDLFIDKVYDSNIKLVIVRTILFPLISCLSDLSKVVVLFYGGYLVLERSLQVGDILAFNVYLSILAFPLTSLGIIIAIYQRGKAALERIGDIHAAAPEHPLLTPSSKAKANANAKAKAKAISTTPLIEFRNLTFFYPSDEKKSHPALKNLNLSINSGDKLGISGPVGSGKSTLFNILCRFYDPPPDTVFFRGQDILCYEPQVLRQEIGLALQVPHLFSNTIKENLSFGLSNKAFNSKEHQHSEGAEKLRQAAEKAAILSDIEAFADGWQTQIGEHGMKLSGGQKQRLALARLYMRDQHVWLLDDVFSAVDAETESRMLSQLDQADKTVLIASHRPRALTKCDEVAYLENGQLIDKAPFSELIKKYEALKQKGSDLGSNE